MNHITLLIKRLGILLILFSLCRVLFYLYNLSYFSEITSADFIIIFLHGIRFDISAILMSNSLFIVLHLIPISQREHPLYQKLLKILFHSFNTITLLTNCIDIEYFKFTFKRSTADLFNMMGLGEDVKNLLPQFLTDYWHIGIMCVLLMVLSEFLYRKTRPLPRPLPEPCLPAGRGEGRARAQDSPLPKYSLGQVGWRFFVQSTLFIVCMGVFVIGFRGGLQLKPIGIITAGKYTAARNIPLVLNTPFAIMTTLGKQELKEQTYFSEHQLNSIFSPYHSHQPLAINSPLRVTTREAWHQPSNINVVVIILESFSSEYIGVLNRAGNSYTPFLDSLASEGLVFDNCFANGKKSIEAVPAILAGLPTLMNNPYITSIYAGNDINSFASLLKGKGYHTSFYHGGNNGTMGFDAFVKAVGFKDYYGRNEYDKDMDYDGTWGIFDEEYFQFFADHLNQTGQPFFSCFFSLTSHVPYKIPKRYEDEFKEGELKIHKSIRYADFALREFFKTASAMPWFDNTLFVITADHTSDAVLPFYQSRVGMYAVPLIFYKHNSALKGINHKTTQQTDIMPSVLHYLNYQDSFIAFGNSVFDTTSEGFAVNFLNGVYQIIDGHHILQFDGKECIGLYNFKTDSVLQNNLLTSEPKIEEQLKRKLKAIIQNYNNRLINNQLTIEK